MLLLVSIPTILIYGNLNSLVQNKIKLHKISNYQGCKD